MKNRIDEIFKSKLENGTKEYSKELWSNIESELFPEQSNRYSGLWLFLLGLLFMMPVYLLKDLNTNSSPGILNKSELSSQNTIALNSPSEFKVEMNDLTSKKDHIQDNNTLQIDQLITSPTSKAIYDDVKQEKLIINNENTAQLIPFKNSNNLLISDNKRTYQNKSSGEVSVFRIVNTGKNQANNNILGTHSNVQYLSSSNNMLHRIDPIQIELQLPIPRYNLDPEYCDSKKISPNKYYSEIFAGIGVATKSYESIASNYDGYKELRENSESSSLSFNAGFGVGYQFNKGFLLEGGFEYAQYNFQLEYKDDRMSTTHITIDTIISANQDTTVFSDTTIVETFTLKRESLRHQNIEIPLLAGMEFKLNNKLSLALKGGIAFNIYSQSSGHMLDVEGTAINIGSDGLSSENNYFKSSFGISFPVQAQLYYKMSPEIDLFAKAGMRYYPNSISRDEFVIKDKIVYNNLNLGIRVQI